MSLWEFNQQRKGWHDHKYPKTESEQLIDENLDQLKVMASLAARDR